MVISNVDFISIVEELFDTSVEGDEEKISFEVTDFWDEKKTFEVKLNYIEYLSSNLSTLNADSETFIYDGKYYEILTRFEGRTPRRLRRGIEIELEDPNNGISYEYKECSDEYLLFLLYKLWRKGDLKYVISNAFIKFKKGVDDLFEMIKDSLSPKLTTMRIKSNTAKSVTEFERIANSFVFQVGFNLDLAIIEMKFLDEFVRTEKINRVRINKTNELEAPKLKYNSDLVYHYQMAITSDSPMLQFISYYHVIEHFFEKIYNDEIIKVISQEITSPNFSVKRSNDILKLVKMISGKIKDRGENYSFDEKEALMLTLIKYVDMGKLEANLNDFDDKLVEYYAANEVEFSKGKKVNLLHQNEQMYKDLASRIYQNRNSIVHSKESQKKLKYIPFTHDKILMKEIPMMRFIAEEIIIATSEVM